MYNRISCVLAAKLFPVLASAALVGCVANGGARGDDDAAPAASMDALLVDPGVVAPPIFSYSTNFAGGVGPEWTPGTLSYTPGTQLHAQDRFLGQFSCDATLGCTDAKLTLSGLPTHTRVTLTFDLYIIRSWDGNSGPDRWSLDVTGVGRLIDTTFSHVYGQDQAYPGSYPGSSNSPHVGAIEVNSLGYGIMGDFVVRVTRSFDHWSPTLEAVFGARGLQSIGNESWGLDNVSVSLERSPVCGDGICDAGESCVSDCGCSKGQHACCNSCIPIQNQCLQVDCPY